MVAERGFNRRQITVGDADLVRQQSEHLLRLFQRRHRSGAESLVFCLQLLNVLEQLEAEHEGFSAGTVAALEQTEQVLGLLADKIRVPDRYLAAVETALGHHLQLVLTEQPESARQVLGDLNANKKGRASVAALALKRSFDTSVLAADQLTASLAASDDATTPMQSAVHALA